jgi:hypothetical protein
MMIEIVNFYPNFRNDNKQLLQGTLHVYLVDLEIDLRGIFVSKKKDFWYFSLPMKIALESDKNTVKYPVISFRNLNKTNQLLQIIKEKGKPFVDDFLKTNPQPIESQKSISFDQAEVYQDNLNEGPVIEKKPISQVKTSSSFKIPTKQWIDLPPRKTQTKKPYARQK